MSRAPRLRALVSASPEDVAGSPGCVCGCAMTTLPPTFTMLQSVDLRVSGHPAQSLSVKPSTVKNAGGFTFFVQQCDACEGRFVEEVPTEQDKIFPIAFTG